MLLWLHYSTADFIHVNHMASTVTWTQMKNGDQILINLQNDRNPQAPDKNRCLRLMDVYDQNKILKRENK